MLWSLFDDDQKLPKNVVADKRIHNVLRVVRRAENKYGPWLETTKGRQKERKNKFCSSSLWRKRKIRDFTLMYQENVRFIYWLLCGFLKTRFAGRLNCGCTNMNDDLLMTWKQVTVDFCQLDRRRTKRLWPI
jgi:hypothetical protein